jgi:glycosyltransferase involved in cell wall biosynthesis
MIHWHDIPVYPTREQRQNAEVLGAYAQHFRADAVISLYDVWALPPNSRRLMGVPWIAMTPVDAAPVSNHMAERLRNVDYIIAYSQFGQREIEKAGFRCHYIPHSIDTDIFSPGNKAQAREEYGFPQDRYVVTIVAANKGFPARKAWAEMLRAFEIFRQDHPEAMLYCHTTKQPFGSGGEGIYFDQLIKRVGIPEDSIAFPNQAALAIGIPDEDMAQIYRSSDVLLLASMGEGFGLPIIEAQACGCPVITQACSAMTELTHNGISIEPWQEMWIPQLNYDWQVPDVGMIYHALGDIYDGNHDAQAGVEFVRGNFGPDVVWNQHWRPFLEHVERTLW